MKIENIFFLNPGINELDSKFASTLAVLPSNRRVVSSCSKYPTNKIFTTQRIERSVTVDSVKQKPDILSEFKNDLFVLSWKLNRSRIRMIFF